MPSEADGCGCARDSERTSTQIRISSRLLGFAALLASRIGARVALRRCRKLQDARGQYIQSTRHAGDAVNVNVMTRMMINARSSQ